MRLRDAPTLTYRNWNYEPDLDEFDDNIKIVHNARSPKGILHPLHYSPYDWMTQEKFDAAVAKIISR